MLSVSSAAGRSEKGGRRVRISYTATTMAKKPFSAEQEVRHYGVVLRQIIRAAGLTVTEVERRLGQGPKSLRRVFCGEVDLKVKHIVSVLHVLGMPEEKFFEIVAERRKSAVQQRTSCWRLLKPWGTRATCRRSKTIRRHQEVSIASSKRRCGESWIVCSWSDRPGAIRTTASWTLTLDECRWRIDSGRAAAPALRGTAPPGG